MTYPSILVGGQTALLINPPIYDTQYWAYWVAATRVVESGDMAATQGYSELRLIDCLATDEKAHCDHASTRSGKRGNVTKTRRMFGMSWRR